jgi:L-ascorbate 6-phosphate lactonase
MNFLERLDKAKPGEKELVLVWLGQAGFLIKTHGGKIILIDPYLTDYANRSLSKEHGQSFRRMTAPLFAPEQINVDVLLCSHEHQDHLDLDAVPGFLKKADIKCYTNVTSIDELEKNSIDTSRFNVLRKGTTVILDEFNFTAVDCDHGDLAPEALGFILDFGFTVIYYSGDTAYNKKRLADALGRRVDVALLPINGAFGNLNAKEAAMFANDLRAKLCIAHHFWTFPAHDAPLGSPRDALKMFPVHAPECILSLATPGELLVIGSGAGPCGLSWPPGLKA